MNGTNSVLKPAILTLTDHNYTRNHVVQSATVNNGKHGIMDDTSSTPPLKKLITHASNCEDDNTMELSDADPNDSLNIFKLSENRKSKSSSYRGQPSNEPYKIVIQNRFDAISNTVDTEETHTSPKTPRIPPIFLHDSNNYQALIADLNKVLKENYFTVNKGSTIKINVSSSDDYRALTAHFDQIGVKYHSFCSPENKRLSVIMRNVPISLSDDEIFSELKSLKYPVMKVARLYNKNKFPMPLCAVELEDSDSGNEIFGLEFLFRSKIHIEMKRKSKSIPQCTRCQRFGHTKNYCKLEPRCVKCTGNHLFSACPKKKEDPVQCVNCSDSHTANYRGCPYYLQIKSKSSQSKNLHDSKNSTYITKPFVANANDFPILENKVHESPSRLQHNNCSPHTSYAKAATGPKSKHTETKPIDSNNDTNENSPLHPVLNSLLQLIKPYISQIKSFISQFISSIFQNGF